MPAGSTYADFWGAHLRLDLNVIALNESLQQSVTMPHGDLLLRRRSRDQREALVGELADRRKAALPVAAAFGGMFVPALIYLAMNAGGAGEHGWGIPMATDIAFAVGVVALAGPRVPTSLKVFLLALAIVDDIGAIVVIAIFYSGGISFGWLAAAAGLFLLVIVLGRVVCGRWSSTLRSAWSRGWRCSNRAYTDDRRRRARPADADASVRRAT